MAGGWSGSTLFLCHEYHFFHNHVFQKQFRIESKHNLKSLKDAKLEDEILVSSGNDGGEYDVE